MNFISAAPEMTLLGLICVVLVADLFVDDEHRILTYWMSMASLAITLWVLLATAPTGGPSVFSGSYVSDGLSQALKIAVTGFVAVAFLYARDYLRANDLHKGEYYVLGHVRPAGHDDHDLGEQPADDVSRTRDARIVAVRAGCVRPRITRTRPKSAMKYFVLGAIASGALLYGISWVYGVTGSIQLDEIAADAGRPTPALNSLPLWFGIAFLIVGIAFKFGAVPFHMWLPDVYHGARSPVTLYIASAPKIAALALTLRILVDGLGDLHEVWADMIMVIAVLSLLLGNIVAIAQTNIKRMLAYSTIAHVGFILLAIFCGTEKGYAAALFYTLTYVVAAAGAFGMVILLSRRGYEAESLRRFQGPECTQPVVCTDDDVPDAEPGRHSAVHRLFRQAERHQTPCWQRLHGARRPDDAGLGRRRSTTTCGWSGTCTSKSPKTSPCCRQTRTRAS